ncbi:BAG domain protein [Ceratobasidium sp. AG-Ba]|nr:BAG domain protein [Ceratobasidium sp. AG-Ba]QRV94042.1 BAG domain protein [Ceratobasidium sp. AG-Ba]QRW08267.1 BAG domain protein [Ceratobasidium sp. AG-Ba]
MSFTVKWGREKIQVMVPPDHYPLSSLRETLSTHTGLPPNSFKLVHSGAVMKDDNAPITSYGIRPGSVLALVGGDTQPPRATQPTSTTSAPPPAPAPVHMQRPVSPPRQQPQAPPAPSVSPLPHVNMTSVGGPEAASIMKIQSEWESFRTKLLPDVQSFLKVLANPPTARPPAEELKMNHKKFAELLLQALLRFDSFQPEGEWNKAREVRKGAVKEVQGMLDQLDGMWEQAKVSGR